MTSGASEETNSSNLSIQPERVFTRESNLRRPSWSGLLHLFTARSSLIQVYVLSAWALGTAVLTLIQGLRILVFRRRLRDAVPAPTWLVEEAERLGERLQVSVPELLVVSGLGTPMLWCLGRPKLLVPGHLLKSIDATRWRGILAHELAHLRREDHWVGRTELAAGLLWWWNPLYWLTCSRLDAEAELACDAWVVRALPDDRLDYAETLFQICSDFSRPRSPSPALGVAGSGHFFERRLHMILHENDSCRVAPLAMVAAGLLALLAVPSWTFATTETAQREAAARTKSVAASQTSTAPVADDVDDDEDGDDDAIDNDADDDDRHDAKKSQDKAGAKDDKKPHKSKPAKGDMDIDEEVGDIEKHVEAALGPDFDKKIEAWAEKFSHDIEEKFGENSEFAKKMEAFGKDLEKKFGDDSEFAKKMEKLGKEMEKKFGPGSDFEKNIKQKFGPGSDFEKKIKAHAEEMERKGKDVARKVEAVQREARRANQQSKLMPRRWNARARMWPGKWKPSRERRGERISSQKAHRAREAEQPQRAHQSARIQASATAGRTEDAQGI